MLEAWSVVQVVERCSKVFNDNGRQTYCKVVEGKSLFEGPPSVVKMFPHRKISWSLPLIAAAQMLFCLQQLLADQIRS